MGCTEYLPMISRFVDEDLSSADAERLLQHLCHCTACQTEWESIERLRYCFHVAGDMEMLPLPGHGFVERAMALLGQEGPMEEQGEGSMSHYRVPSQGRSSSLIERLMAWIHSGVAVPAWVRPFGYVAPVIVIVLLAVWLIPERERGTIDVSSIKPSTDLSASLVQSSQAPENYLFHHATVQPLGTLVEEVSFIQGVPDQGR